MIIFLGCEKNLFQQWSSLGILGCNLSILMSNEPSFEIVMQKGKIIQGIPVEFVQLESFCLSLLCTF